MKLEQPKINTGGNLAQRVEYLERYIYRLTNELQMALNALEQEQNLRKEQNNG